MKYIIHLFLGETECADLVAIWVVQIGRIGRRCPAARTWLTFIGATIRKARFVELIDRVARG